MHSTPDNHYRPTSDRFSETVKSIFEQASLPEQVVAMSMEEYRKICQKLNITSVPDQAIKNIVAHLENWRSTWGSKFNNQFHTLVPTVFPCTPQGVPFSSADVQAGKHIFVLQYNKETATAYNYGSDDGKANALIRLLPQEIITNGVEAPHTTGPLYTLSESEWEEFRTKLEQAFGQLQNLIK